MSTGHHVIVIGAGLSGLYTARELLRAGHEVTVLEGRDRIGGRLLAARMPSGRLVDAGGEFVGPVLKELDQLASELGLTWKPLFYDETLRVVQIIGGERVIEDYPLASDPEAFAESLALHEEIGRLAALVDVNDPAAAPEFAALDQMSVSEWLDSQGVREAVRSQITLEANSLGGADAVSMLFLVWQIARFGGWDAYAAVSEGHFVETAAELPARLAAAVGAENIRLSTAVAAVSSDADGVVVTLDGGERLTADALVVATGGAPNFDIDPPLPPEHRALADGWVGHHGAKVFFEYDRPWWRDEKLGSVVSDGIVQLVFDGSGEDGTGLLVGLVLDADLLEGLTDADIVANTEDMLALALGERARTATSTLVCNWLGDPSNGCGTGLRVGALTAARTAITDPTGRVFWAGGDRGRGDYMQGAVTAGQRVVAQVQEALDGVVVP